MSSGLHSPREVIGPTLAKLAEQDPKLVVLDADLGRSTRLTSFEERFPERYLQMGVAEQNALGVASGLVYAGYNPVFVTFTMFSIGLPWTQLRQAAYAGLPLTVIGTHPGFDIGPDGGTHQMLSDLALARVIPELVVLSPCDSPETIAAIRTAVGSDRLVYVRVGRQPVPDLHDQPIEFLPIGCAELLKDDGRDCVLIADGSMVATAMKVADRLADHRFGVSVVNIRSIKPLDEDLIRELAREATLLITVENHTILGGLGGAVAEITAEEGGRLARIGIRDRFGESATTDDLRRLHQLDTDGVYNSVLTLLRQR